MNNFARIRISILMAASLLAASTSRAELWSDHLQPTIEDGFDSTGLLIAAGGLVAVALAQPQDTRMREDWSQNNRMNHSASRFGDILGTGIPGVAIALGQIYYDTENGTAHAEALFDTFVVTSILKYSAARARPDSENHLSMPSGHTSTTFATATSLAYAYGWKAAVPAYALAAFTGFTRLSDDAHWFSDTVGGAFVGIFWARAASLHHSPEKKRADSTSARSEFLPVVSSRLIGAFWRYKF